MKPEAFERFDLTGKTALVTGGGTGLGYHIARTLARSGARVMISARREDVLKDAASRLTDEAWGNEVLYSCVDLSDQESVDDCARNAVKKMGSVDIYVGNAGQEHMQLVEDIDPEVVQRMNQVNVTANMSLVRAFLPGMKEKCWGRVIFMASVAAIRATVEPGMSVYGANKASLNAYTRVAAAELGPLGITVNSINAGTYMTEMMVNMVDEMNRESAGNGDAFVRGFGENTAIGRMGECEEIEGMVQLLASDAGSYITGACLEVDGGLAIMMRPRKID